MWMLKHSVLVLSLPLLMVSLAGAQVAPDEADERVERVIKAAQEIHLDAAPALDLAPRKPASEGGWYLGGQLVNITGDGTPEEMLLTNLPTFTEGPRIESDVRVESY